MSENEEKKATTAAPVETKVESAPAAPAVEQPKKKKKHLLLKIILVILLIVVIGVAVLLMMIDNIIVGAVRTVAPRVTGTKVELASVSTSILRGHVALNGFKVGNPEGYQEANIFELNEFICDVTPASVFSDKIIIDQVVVDGMKFNYEPKLSGGSNLSDIQHNIEAFTGADKKQSKPAAETPAESGADKEKSKKQIFIRKIVVKNVEMSFSNKMLNTTIPLKIPDITITNDGDGKTMAAALQEFFVELTRSAAKVIGESGRQLGEGAQKALDDLNATGQKALENVGVDGRKALEGLGAEGQKAIENAGEEGKKALESLKGVFGK